ncbi:MAG: TolC family protein [Pirellulales bacterium]
MHRVTCLVVLGLLPWVAVGCSRGFYRRQADGEVYNLLGQVASDPRWALQDYTVNIDPRSRMYDPTCPDRPPMPPDDPTAHRLMHCVDCMKGYPCWHKYGDTPYSENPCWQKYLARDASGALVLDRQGAMEMALLNSRNYQQALETLYLSAMDVTFESYRFDTQFFGTNATFFTADGPARNNAGRSSSRLTVDNNILANRLFPAGGELVVGLANSLVWQFAGPNTYNANTLLDFSLVQPLLRGAGRARVLERLTIAERSLLANVRQMERYRQGFYVEIVTGRSAGSGPSRRGGLFGGSGLEGFSGVGSGGFGRVGESGGGGGGGFAGGAGAAEAGGFMGLLQDQLQIHNRQAYVAGLGSSLAQLEALNAAGRIDRFQVDLARQALYNAESVLLTAKAAYESTLDTYKINLGLPPDLDVKIEDPLLARFELINPALAELQETVTRTVEQMGGTDEKITAADLSRELGLAVSARQRSAAQMAVVERDFDLLEAALPARRKSLDQLLARSESQGRDLNTNFYNSKALDQRVEELKKDFARLVGQFEATSAELEQLRQEAVSKDVNASYAKLRDYLTVLSGQMLELSLIQARARLDASVLTPVELTSPQALAIAQQNRLDWMNARLGLVDSWRLIEFNANLLKAGLNVVFSGDINTTDNNPVRFRGTTGRLRVGLEFDSPLTRLAERNTYRESLIDYQQARRAYYAYVDRVNQGLRNTLRTIDLNQLNFELRRAAVHVAISQVDITRLRLSEPPKPGVTTTLSVTTARDLVTALADLLSVQNDFLSVWVNTEVQRMGLDFDLGTMKLDDRGLWIDPGPIGPLPSCEAKPTETEDALPEDIPPMKGNIEELPELTQRGT